MLLWGSMTAELAAIKVACDLLLCHTGFYFSHFNVDLLTECSKKVSSYGTEYKWMLLQWDLCLRPYHTEYTGSRLITEVKQCWACLVR